MYRAIQNFVDRLTESTDQDCLRQSMADIATTLNLSCFAYLSFARKLEDPPKLISTYPPTWTAHYLGRHYERFDPVVGQAIRDTRPFRWGLGLGPRARSEFERELFEEAARFGIRYGFTIPIHDSKGAIAAVSFATDERRTKFERSINEHAQALRLMAMFFHAHAGRMLRSERMVDGVLLSPREFECLEWYSLGKSAWEIGNILGISPRTVGFHRDNARAKLGVRTIHQAVVRLAESKSRR
ncbi:LuxR family transcriptional regulator [Bradyrhizobium sp. CCGUVB4N]|uniref:helix-turn-helix transcriptional regulator n=1 Tax=Bradyrhizobium sp. CCGUVB4N TaxID=2949631 RepID=UPI0020B406CD|nr:LuxR family transcriptional regulator [Bradyrhizobium sp. CCGUVB4N]MCP3380280.1 LuxR family transcriptional regulator [Bradyrhizobium sp. CCGUVB4N]